MKKYYDWYDANDPFADKSSPALEDGLKMAFGSKKDAKADFKVYASDTDFGWIPKMQLIRITVEEV
jgi:hypothetical protein